MEDGGDLDMIGRLGVGGVTWEEGEHLDFATIAKAGGRKDLLHHLDTAQSNKNRSPAPPVSVDWFAHPIPPPRQSTVYVSPLKDHWCQWNTTIPKLPEIGQQRDNKAQTYPPLTNRDNVNFARLLSLDYQREWLQKRYNKQEKQRKQAKERKMSQLKKLQDHSMTARKNQEPPSDPKDRFIMKRFKNIPSKVKLPPI